MDIVMTRIESALARIEAAGQGRETIASHPAPDSAIRSKVEKALAELDGLIAELEG